MITTIISTLVAQRWQEESIYTLKLVRKGINIFGGREINVLRSLKVSDVVKQSIEVIPENARFNTIMEKVVNSNNNSIYVKNATGELTGYISMQEIRQTLLDFEALKDLLIAGDVANPNLIIVNDKDNLDFVMKQFGHTDQDELPVISKQGNKTEIIGTIWQSDVIEAYNHQIFLRDMSGELGQSFQHLKRMKTVHVVDNYHFSEIEAPAALVGKTLQEINLRNKFDLELLLIKRAESNGKEQKTIYIQPGGKTKIHMNDMLLVFGGQEKIEYLSRI